MNYDVITSHNADHEFMALFLNFEKIKLHGHKVRNTSKHNHETDSSNWLMSSNRMR